MDMRILEIRVMLHGLHAKDPFKLFFLTNTEGIQVDIQYPGAMSSCAEGEGNITMHVNVTVDCTDQKRDSTCGSMGYAWDCLNGRNGYPSASECESYQYDGNGKIQIGDGQYTFHESIDTTQ
eukprot:1012039_1